MKKNHNSEITFCENCGSNQFILLFSGGDKLLGLEGNFNILECKNCGIYLLSPKLPSKEMERYYPEEYICYQGAIEDDPHFLSRLNRNGALQKRCKIITKISDKPGKILDVGCATGIFLNGMEKRGWEGKGIEPNQSAAEYAKQRFGLDVFCGYLFDANLPDDYFDVITIWDVLEHVPDPGQLMCEIYRLLKPGGVVIATLPNGKAWERFIFKEYWVGWEIPRHYRTYTPTTITNFLKEQSFNDIRIFSFIGRHGAFMISVQFWLNTWQAAKWKKTLINHILGSIVFRILTHPFFLIAEMFNRSNIMSFSAKKLTEK